MKPSDLHLIRTVTRPIPRSTRILDVGCGMGEIACFLRDSLGFTSITCADINPDMVAACRSRGLPAFPISDPLIRQQRYDMLVMSHVVEHIPYPGIQDFLESYFHLLEADGVALISAPLLRHEFYDDADHIKPYTPEALLSLFSAQVFSRQYTPNFIISLRDIGFRREIRLPRYLSCYYRRDFISRITTRVIRDCSTIADWLSVGLLRRTTGYCALFSVSRRATVQSESRVM